MAIDTDREALHTLVDAVPDSLLAQARAVLEQLVNSPGYPDAPEDDEPVTDEDLEAIARGRAAYRRGETIPDEVVRRELGF
jgi:hypothetical protein